MKKLILAVLCTVSLALLVFGYPLHGANLSFTVGWDAPTTNTDGTPLVNLKEYKIFRTDGTRVLLGTVQAPTQEFLINITVPDGSSGTSMFVVRAVNTLGTESVDSNVLAVPFDYRAPAAPSNLKKK